MEAIPLVDLRAEDALVGAEVRAAVMRVAASGQFVLGDEVRTFEAAIAERVGVAAAVGVASGSDALFLALVAAGIGPGDEVVTTALSYFATAGAIVRAGATPRFVDVEPDGFGLDPARVEAALTPRTRALLPVHLFGRCVRIEPLVALASVRGLVLIEDVAQAIDAERGGRRAGAIGRFGCLSFHPSKNLGGWGDGGMVLCRDAADADVLRRLRAHGGDGGVHEWIGVNSRLDALQAAVLGAKLQFLAGFGAARRERATRYRALLAAAGLEGELTVGPPDTEGVEVVHHFVVRCRRRDELRAHLAARGIGVGVYYPRPLHLQPCFAALGGKEGDCPVAERATRELLSLPVSPGVTPAQQERVVSEIRAFYRGGAA